MGQVDSIIDLIYNGAVDDDLDAITEAVKYRRKDLANDLLRSVTKGDKVRIKPGTLDKRYLDGAEGEVVEARVSKIVVAFPDDMPHENDPYQKYAGRSSIIPATCLEKVS